MRAVELGVGQDVIWAGPVDGAAYVAAFDVLAHASLYEAFAYVFLEALGSGVPFVSTRVGVSEELAQSGGAGFVCEPWDAERFAEFLLLLIENPGLRGAMSEAAKKVVEAFDLDRMLNKISDLYDRVAPICATQAHDLKTVAGGPR
jgi:glycosyltransferase involved in cell wall biosynthesis